MFVEVFISHKLKTKIYAVMSRCQSCFHSVTHPLQKNFYIIACLSWTCLLTCGTSHDLMACRSVDTFKLAASKSCPKEQPFRL